MGANSWVKKDGVTRLRPDLRALIEAEASAVGIDPDLAEAIARTENGPENDHNPAIGVSGILPTTDNVHGLMQIKLAAAYDVGFVTSDLTQDPVTGIVYSPALQSNELSIKFGVRYLATRGLVTDPKWRCTGPDDIACMISSYERGTAYTDDNGEYVNKGYVNKVLSYYAQIKGFAAPTDPVGPIDDPVPRSNLLYKCVGFDPISESLLPFPTPPSPYMAYFNIKVNDVDFTPSRPQYVTYFEFTEELERATEFRMRTFDPFWDKVSGDVLDATFEEAKFPPFANVALSFGYVSGAADTYLSYASVFGDPGPEGVTPLWSNQHHLRLESYNPEFLGWGVEIEMYGRGNDYLSAMEAKNRTWVRQLAANGGGEVSATAVFEDICEEEGWKPCSAPTQFILDKATGGGDLTDEDRLKGTEPQPLIITQSRKSNVDFLRDDLAPLCKANGSDASGYVFHLQTDTLPPTAHFHPLNLDPSNVPVRRYTYARGARQGDRGYGAIISFKAQIDTGPLLAYGGGKVVYEGINAMNKEENTVESNPSSHTNIPRSGPNVPPFRFREYTDRLPVLDQENPPKEVKERVATRRHVAAQNFKDTVLTENLAIHQKAKYLNLNAELTIIGDPLLHPGRNVEVWIQTFQVGPDNDGGQAYYPHFHFTSGIWYVRRITHIIQSGEYISILGLLRNDLPTLNPHDVIDLQNNDPVFGSEEPLIWQFGENNIELR